jgi:hypothetical protein
LPIVLHRRRNGTSKKTYIISFIKDHSRPLIGSNKGGEYIGSSYDSETFSAHLDEERPLRDYKPIEITVQREDALRYDIYTLVGCTGLLSTKAVDVLGGDMLANCIKLPGYLNGAPFFARAVSQTTAVSIWRTVSIRELIKQTLNSSASPTINFIGTRSS